MKPLDIHDEWLSLIEISGPFLATPVLNRVFSTGLPAVEPRIRQYLRQAYDEWCEARDTDDPRFSELHRAWIQEVLARGLEYDEFDSGEFLLHGERMPAGLRATLPEHGVTLVPDYALVSGGKSQLLVQIYPAGMDLQAALKIDGWIACPAERMERLCRASGCRLGLVTDGERWMLVDAPVGAVSTFASWYARLWGQERLTLQAFLTLLGIRRFFGPDDESLPSMLDESLKHQEEVTDALGEQVRRAVEVLIQALDKEDRESSRTLLQGVEPTELYEAALNIMMRLVFLLSAEERGLLLMGEEPYESNYAISTLRMQLHQETDEILEQRHDAWSRLLATFRAVYGGIEHESLLLPALGGSLFDPDRFPFLEGRAKGSNWRVDFARPLPIDNRTVLLLLEAIQLYEGRSLSYRALDVEQIGYVYEGLLERTVTRAERVTVELIGNKGAKKTLYGLEELEALHRRSDGALIEALSGVDAIKRVAGTIRKDLERSVDAAQASRLLTACAGDEELRDRILPFHNLLRTDAWDYPLIYPEGAYIVTTGGDRRDTGTHYTPKSLTERIVETTLEPITYVGLIEGLPREQWSLKSASELLDLKICDPAMGSGAFLVQACRWLAERIVEAWMAQEASGWHVTSEGEVVDDLAGREALSSHLDDRLVVARRMVAERCLYGVDINPLAVELAKLSIWLVTLAKGRPFGFLDHNLKCGNSLLGIHRLDQLTELSMKPRSKGQQRLFGNGIKQAVFEAIELRQKLRRLPIRDIHDVKKMASLNVIAHKKTEMSSLVANAFVGEVLNYVARPSKLEVALSGLAALSESAVSGDVESISRLTKLPDLHEKNQSSKEKNNPFHWPLEYPEVFFCEKSGFDAVISNPPWGAELQASTHLLWKTYEGDKLDRLVDSFHLFVIRSSQLIGRGGACFSGLVVPDVLLYQEYSRPLREFLLKKCNISSVCNLGGEVFTGVTRPCCYVIFSADKKYGGEISVGKWHLDRVKSDELAFNLPVSSLESFPGCIIPTGNLAEFSQVAHWISAIPSTLSDFVDDYGIQRGASADNKNVFVLRAEQAAQENLECDYLRPVVTGGIHLKPFQISKNLPSLIYTTRDTSEHLIPNISAWVRRHAAKITCKEVAQGKHPIYALHRPRDVEIFERKVKLLGVITADRPKVAVDTEQLYALDGVYLLAPREGIDPYYLAGILNSSVMSRIYRVLSQEEGRVMAQVKPTTIAGLPVISPESEDEVSNLIASRVSDLTRKMHSAYLVEDEYTSLFTELDALVASLFDRACALRSEGSCPSKVEVGV